MFRYETSNIIIILVILIIQDIQIIALDLRFKGPSNELKTQFKNHKHNVREKDEFYPVDKDILDVNDYGIEENLRKNPLPYKLNEYSNEDLQENYVRKSNPNFGFEDPSYDYSYSDSSEQIRRRETPSETLYPSVLTKALEISFNSSAPINAGGNLLSNVAQKMNTSALDLAKILTKTENANNDDEFSKIIENYKKTQGISKPHSQNLQKGFEDSGPNGVEHVEGIAASNLASILDHVLNKLEVIEKMKYNEDNDEYHPDGIPCDIAGSWSSTSLGFCFDIQLHKEQNRYIPPAEINNKVLSINISECIPAKHHQIIDIQWKFTGSAIKQWGGPFYIYGQKKSEGILSTFLGFCLTCNGIDTIFGSWNILSPTKDCHDVSLANEIKRDILRRVRMETKRKERFKNLLYQSRHGKL